MEFLDAFRSVLSFLAIIPAGSFDINQVAKAMFLFPAAGAIIGVIVGGLAFGASFVLSPMLVGLVTAASLVILTGLHHTDALADFADGVMAKGPIETKHKAMLDPAVGSAGVTALVIYFAGMAIVFQATTPGMVLIFTNLVAAEVIAKFSMVFIATISLSAWSGQSSPFTTAMKDPSRLGVATALALPLVWFSAGIGGLVALAASVAVAILLRYTSQRNFGGISGDVLGASNEITRLCSLVILFSGQGVNN